MNLARKVPESKSEAQDIKKQRSRRKADNSPLPSGASPGGANGGGPLMIDINLIDEDPDQPRTRDNPGFSRESIAELAASFGPKGPKSPISLRVNPDQPGRYLINHGARRTRAARVKRLTTLPAFIDNDYSVVDQVIENLQRDNLTPREIADWIGRELARGMKKGEIARSVGKSAAFVSQHANLLNLPDAIAMAFNSGRTNDVTVVNELVTAFKKNPNEVTDWLADERREITRGEVKLLREFLDEKSGTNRADRTLNLVGGLSETAEPAASEDGEKVSNPKVSDPTKLKKAVVQVEHKGRCARLLLTRRPTAEGYAWLKNEDDGHEFEASVMDIALLAVREG